MPSVFVDTDYWVASISPKDGLHQKAIAVSGSLGSYTLVTSEMVLAEVLNMFAKRGVHLREMAVDAVEAITTNPQIDVEPQTRRLFRDALSLYGQRLDKDWSLTDCASYVIMQKRHIGEALTHDHHFEQMGHKALLR